MSSTSESRTLLTSDDPGVKGRRDAALSLLKRGALTDTTTTPLTGVSATDYLQIAAVGTDVVVWDQDTSTLYLPGGKTQRIDGERVVLQDTGPKRTRSCSPPQIP